MILSFITKWLGLQALKAAFKKILMNTVIKPAIEAAGDYVQEAVDDPDTDFDDNMVDGVEKYLKWMAEKKLDDLID